MERCRQKKGCKNLSNSEIDTLLNKLQSVTVQLVSEMLYLAEDGSAFIIYYEVKGHLDKHNSDGLTNLISSVCRSCVAKSEKLNMFYGSNGASMPSGVYLPCFISSRSWMYETKTN